MAGPRLLDTEITTKTRNRAEQVGMHGPRARPGARHRESPCAGCWASLREVMKPGWASSGMNVLPG